MALTTVPSLLVVHIAWGIFAHASGVGVEVAVAAGVAVDVLVGVAVLVGVDVLVGVGVLVGESL